MNGVSFRFDAKKWEQRLTTVEERQLPYAQMLALNDTVVGARKAVQGQMQGDLDRPTPFAKRGVRYERATKQHLTAEVVIHGDRTFAGGLPAAYFLGPQVHGGRRSLKAFEKQLAARGFLPAGHVAVPASRQKLDRYGNISQGQLNKILSGLHVDYRGAGATRVASTDRGKARARRRGRYFVPKQGSHLFPGIYQVSASGAKVWPVMLFVKATSYQKRLDFYGPIERHVARNWGRNFEAAWQRAMRTAR